VVLWFCAFTISRLHDSIKSPNFSNRSDLMIFGKEPDRVDVINFRSDQLRSLAAEGLTPTEALTAIGRAHAHAIVDLQHRFEVPIAESLEVSLEYVHDQAHIACGLIPPQPDQPLSEQEFGELVQRIINLAVKNGRLPEDALAATSKALGTLAAFTARRNGRSMKELIEFAQTSVGEFARGADAFMDANPQTDPAR
jgi:hypothetical protein